MTSVGLIVGGLGFALIYSAITGQPFLETLRTTFTTPASQHKKGTPGAIDREAEIDWNPQDGTTVDGVYYPPVPGVGTPGGDVPDSKGGGNPTTPPLSGNPCRSLPIPTNLVKIGQSGHSLRADAAASHARASSASGGFINVTDSFRTYQQQADCHAAKPTTCAAAGGSCHEKGVAIDVVDMKNQRVIDALTAEGWVRFAPDREPWHWSYQVRG